MLDCKDDKIEGLKLTLKLYHGENLPLDYQHSMKEIPDFGVSRFIIRGGETELFTKRNRIWITLLTGPSTFCPSSSREARLCRTPKSFLIDFLNPMRFL